MTPTSYGHPTGSGSPSPTSPRGRGPYTDVGIVSAQGDQPIQNLTNSGYFSSNPRWSTDGNILLYATDKYGMRNHASWGSMNDIMAVFLNRAAYEKFRMNDEDLALLEEAEKQAKADTTKTKKAQPAKSTNGVIEWDNLDLRTVRITPTSSRLGDYILSSDNKKLFYFSATEAGQDLWVYDMRKHTTQLQKKMDLSSPFFRFGQEGHEALHPRRFAH